MSLCHCIRFLKSDVYKDCIRAEMSGGGSGSGPAPGCDLGLGGGAGHYRSVLETQTRNPGNTIIAGSLTCPDSDGRIL